MQNNEIKKNSWIFFADNDLGAAEFLFTKAEFTGEIVFLCQQAVEKYLKAVLFELKIPIQKTHDLPKLYNEVKKFKNWEIDETLLNNLCDLYIESRYPTDVALLGGEVLPSVEDAKMFLEFAQSVAKIAKAEIQLG
jgi:HEPN domain-containing protein